MKIKSTLLNKLIREEYNKLLLVEESVDNIYEKYYKGKVLDNQLVTFLTKVGVLHNVSGYITFSNGTNETDIFEKIISIDPFTKLPNKMGKYSKWLLKYAKTIENIHDLNRFIGEDRVRVTDYLKKYERLVMSDKLPSELRQIDNFKSPNELYTKVIEPYFKVEQDDTKEIEKKLLKTGDAEIVFNGSEWQIVVPKTEQSACIFGSNTEWCTAWGEYSTNPSYRQRTNYFSNGDRHGQDWKNDPLYIIINKNNSKEKYQFHFGSEQFKNKNDDDVEPLELLEKYTELKSYFLKNEYDILRFWGVKKYKLNSEGLIDVEGNVDLSNKGLTKLPVKFGHVSGYFWCSSNNLTDLNGAPKTVGGDFWCSKNNLTDLNGAPKSVGRNFTCSNNNLTSLNGAPKTVCGEFVCSYNELQNLKGAPKSVGRNFTCSYNQLTSLNGAPKTVGGSFYCSNNQLTSLKGAPKTVGRDFYLYNNRGKQFTENEVRSVCDVKGWVYV